MSKIYYGPVTMNMIQLKSYSVEPAMSDDDSDMMFNRHRLHVMAIVTQTDSLLQQYAQLGPPAPLSSAAREAAIPALGGGFVAGVAGLTGNPTAKLMKQIRHSLSLPRRQFTWEIYGTPYLQSAPPGPDGYSLDSNNGPKPRVLSISKLTEASFLVEWAIEFCEGACDESLPGVGVAALRFSQTTSYDERWYAILRTTGYLIVRSDLRVNPDQLRGLVTPFVANGFYRTKSSYQLAENGLRLNFDFEEQQRYRLPPAGIAKATGKFTVMSGDSTSATMIAMVQLHLEGYPSSNVSEMIEIGARIAVTKINAASPQKNKGCYIGKASITENLWDNEVDITVQAVLDNSAGSASTAARNAAALAFAAVINAGGDVKAAARAARDAANGVGGVTQEQFNALAINRGVFGTPLDLTNPDLSPIIDPANPIAGIAPSLRGNAPFLSLVASYFNDPCLSGSAAAWTAATGPPPPPSAASLGFLSGLGILPTSTSGQNPSMSSGGNPASTTGQNPSMAGGNSDFAQSATQLSFSIVSNSQAPITPGQEDESLINDDSNPGLWESWMISTRFNSNQNKVMLPTCQAGASAIIIQLAAPTITANVTWTASKTGAQPEIPPQTPLNSNSELLTAIVDRENVVVAADGVTLKYTASGIYSYAFYNPTLVNQTYPVPPWLMTAEVEEDEDGDSELVWGQQPTTPIPIIFSGYSPA